MIFLLLYFLFYVNSLPCLSFLFSVISAKVTVNICKVFCSIIVFWQCLIFLVFLYNMLWASKYFPVRIWYLESLFYPDDITISIIFTKLTIAINSQLKLCCLPSFEMRLCFIQCCKSCTEYYSVAILLRICFIYCIVHIT